MDLEGRGGGRRFRMKCNGQDRVASLVVCQGPGNTKGHYNLA